MLGERRDMLAIQGCIQELKMVELHKDSLLGKLMRMAH